MTWFNAFTTYCVTQCSLITISTSDVPTTDDATHFPNISIPSCSARSRVVRIHNAAPSPTPEAFPAVVNASPQSGNTGFSFDKESMVTPGLIVSSSWKTLPRISTGMISSLNIPSFCDCRREVSHKTLTSDDILTFSAREWDIIAYLSCFCLGTW